VEGEGDEIGVVDVRAGGETHDHSACKHHKVCENLSQSEEPNVLLSLLSIPLIPSHCFPLPSDSPILNNAPPRPLSLAQLDGFG